MQEVNCKTDEDFKYAIDAVVSKRNIHSVAKEAGIEKSLLWKIVKRAKLSQKTGDNFTYNKYIGNRKIFLSQLEKLLASYLTTASQMCNGLTKVQTRELAYQFAVAN